MGSLITVTGMTTTGTNKNELKRYVRTVHQKTGQEIHLSTAKTIYDKLKLFLKTNRLQPKDREAIPYISVPRRVVKVFFLQDMQRFYRQQKL